MEPVEQANGAGCGKEHEQEEGQQGSEHYTEEPENGEQGGDIEESEGDNDEEKKGEAKNQVGSIKKYQHEAVQDPRQSQPREEADTLGVKKTETELSPTESKAGNGPPRASLNEPSSSRPNAATASHMQQPGPSGLANPSRDPPAAAPPTAALPHQEQLAAANLTRGSVYSKAAALDSAAVSAGEPPTVLKPSAAAHPSALNKSPAVAQPLPSKPAAAKSAAGAAAQPSFLKPITLQPSSSQATAANPAAAGAGAGAAAAKAEPTAVQPSLALGRQQQAMDPKAATAAAAAQGAQSQTIRRYLDSTVTPVLRAAMRDLCTEKPEDPWTFLADYILAHKPK